MELANFSVVRPGILKFTAISLMKQLSGGSLELLAIIL